MPEPEQYETAEEGDGENVLTRKIGPLATWQWAAVVVGGYFLYRFISGRSGGGSSSGPVTNANVPFSDPSTIPGIPGPPGPAGPPGPPGKGVPTPTPTPAKPKGKTLPGNPKPPAKPTKPIVSKPIAKPMLPGSGTSSHKSGTTVHIKSPATHVNNERTPVTAVRSGQKYEGGPTTTIHTGSIASTPIPPPAPYPRNNDYPTKL